MTNNQLNWSHFRPDFSGKPEEDAEGHLLRTMEWMTTHDFPEDEFCNTREQYFHVWRSFQFDEATNTIDGYIQKVKQMATLLDYGELQILELFKNTLPSRLYYMMYQIDDLRVVVETAKRLLTKEQMDKKAGQFSASSFMQVNQNSYKNKDKMEKKVSFSAVVAMERTADSIERLASSMDKMDTKLDRREDQYRPRVYQGRSTGCSYRQNNYWL